MLADQLPNGFVYRMVRHPDGTERFTFVSEGVEQVLGLTPQAIYADARAIAAAVVPEDRPALEAARQRAVAGDGSLDHVFTAQDSTGRMRLLHFRARSRIKSDNSVVWKGVCLDVTAGRQFEIALRESEERFRSFMDHCPAAAFIKDEDGRFLYVNPVWLAQFDPQPTDWLGKTDFDFWPAPVAELFRASDRKCLTQGPVHTEESGVARDGSEFIWMVMKFPIVRQGRRMVAGMAWDITQRKRLEAELRQAHKMDSVGRLAGGVAHDFNNLLTVINGYSDIALGSLAADDPVRPLVDEIRKAGERAAGLTRQLLAFSRKQMLQPKVIDLATLVNDLGNMLRRIIGEDIELVLKAVAGTTWVMADPSQLEQVVVNMAVNARDAMPTGGTLTIETRPAEPKGETVADTADVQSGPYVQLSVTDTGMGMDADTRARIFEPFFTTKGIGKGTGLGLATVYGIVLQSGGRLAVESELGKGTTFHVHLPAAPPPAVPMEKPAARTLLPGGGETILLVEDDDGVRELALRALQDAGYVVLDAANGERALQLAQTYGVAIRLLVTDVVMPGISGRELAEQLLAKYPTIDVVYMSGYTDDAVMRHGIESDRVHFLPKPYALSALTAKVREVLAE